MPNRKLKSYFALITLSISAFIFVSGIQASAQGTATSIGIYSGNSQTADVASGLTLDVICRDASGSYASHTEVDWTVEGGGGSIPYSYSLTEGGIATKVLTLGTAPGINYITATIHGTSKSITFTEYAVAGPIAGLQIVGGNDQTGAANKPLPDELTVAAVDAHGNRKSGAAIHWVANTSGDAFSPASESTNSAGLASAKLTLGSTSLLHRAKAVITGTAISQAFTETLWVNGVVTFASNPSPNPKAFEPYFLGLSYMKVWMTSHLFNANNTALVALFKKLGPGVIRLNGDQPLNPVIWDPNGPGLQYGTVSRADIARMAAFLKATDWKVLYGIALVDNTTSAAASEAAVAADEFGSSLLGFEIGNEPDLYAVPTYGDPKVAQIPGYTYDDFISSKPVYSNGKLIPSWGTFATAIRAAVPDAPLTGMAGGWDWVDTFAATEGSKLSLLTRHIYQGQYTPVLTMGTLLTTDPRVAVQFPAMDEAALAAGISGGYRISECNTYALPLNGVTNAFGAALWTIDFLFANAAYHSTGVNFMGGAENYATNSPLVDNGTNVIGIGPDYYGLLAYSMMIKGGTQLLTRVTPAPGTFSAYAVQEPDGSMDMILSNKSPTSSFTVGIDRADGTSLATSVLLTGPSLTATSGFTLGGSQVSINGNWEATNIDTLPIIEDQAIVTVPAASAQIVHLR